MKWAGIRRRIGRLGAGKIMVAALLSTIGLAVPAVAQADTINFTFENPDGVGQGGTNVQNYPAAFEWWADAYGQKAISGVAPGDQLHITRDKNTSCPAPEGAAGVVYTVPNPVPSSATITLPSSSFASSDPAVSNPERGEVGLINQERAAANATDGLTAAEPGYRWPLQISTVLSDAADRYSNYLEATGGVSNDDPLAHCHAGSPASRIIDRGYPYSHSGYGEIISGCGSAYGAFNCWKESIPHHANMLNPSWRVIGVGRVAGTWTADFQPACTIACERAGLTGDYGDPALADGDPNDGKTNDDDPSGPGAKCAALAGAKRKACIAKAIRKCKRKHAKKRKRCIKRVKANNGVSAA